MINPAELRIGNWVGVQKNKYEKVASLYSDGGIGLTNGFFYEKSEYNLYAIPLTPEILEKCGFEKHQMQIEVLSEQFWKLNFIQLWEVGGDKGQYQVCIIGKMIPLIIKSVHQLQNLHFTLTGEELTYTP